MGKLIKRCKMRTSVYVVYGLFSFILLFLFFIASYGKEFFSMYRSVSGVFSTLQFFCVLLIIALGIIVYLQYQKAGVVAFYTNGLVIENTGQRFLYHDIVMYDYESKSNKTASVIRFQTDDGRSGQITALLSPEAFDIFQKQHAAIWGPFILKKIESGTPFHVDLQEDFTSFKLSLAPQEEVTELVLQKEGIVVYKETYAWSDLKRYEVSWSGLLSIKDQENRAVFLEPATSIPKYELVLFILEHYLPTPIETPQADKQEADQKVTEESVQEPEESE